LLSALVAAQTVTALEIKETGLTQSAPVAQIMLAQVENDDISEADRAQGNDNSDSVHDDTESTNSVISDSNALDDKIDALTDSQLAGLEAKEKYMTDKIKYLAAEKYDQFCAIEETCREKMSAQKEESKRILDEAFALGVANAKKCRTDFVDAQLVKKEIVKGQLEDKLNVAIQKIKELKVEGVFAESGLPVAEHETKIATAIAAEIADFQEASNELLTNTGGTGFADTLTTDTSAFANTDTNVGTSCLDEVRNDFNVVFTGDSMVVPPTDASRGEKYIYDAAVELCFEKMNDQVTEATAEINAKITGYTDDAGKQENKARETFLRLIESSMVKLHGLTDLTASEVVTLKDAIINKRDEYARDVMGWSGDLDDTL
jgi:hypothetical protein